jgi:hypothetical protein
MRFLALCVSLALAVGLAIAADERGKSCGVIDLLPKDKSHNNIQIMWPTFAPPQHLECTKIKARMYHFYTGGNCDCSFWALVFQYTERMWKSKLTRVVETISAGAEV